MVASFLGFIEMLPICKETAGQLCIVVQENFAAFSPLLSSLRFPCL
jgi:hypothetical protein